MLFESEISGCGLKYRIDTTIDNRVRGIGNCVGVFQFYTVFQ